MSKIHDREGRGGMYVGWDKAGKRFLYKERERDGAYILALRWLRCATKKVSVGFTV